MFRPQSTARAQSRTGLWPNPTQDLKRPTTVIAATTEEDRDNFDRVASMARDAYTLTKEIMGELNVEQKVLHQQGSPTALWDGVAGTQLLNDMAQGVTDSTRTGDSVKYTNMSLRFCMYSNATVAAVPVMSRIVVWWQQGADLCSNLFPTSVGATDGVLDWNCKNTIEAVLATKDFDASRDVEILFDHSEVVIPQQKSVVHHRLLRLNKHSQFENNTSNIATGFLRIGFVTNSSVAHQALCVYNTDLYFVDN